MTDELIDALEIPDGLKDAWARIDRAADDYKRLAGELEMFLYDHIKGMVLVQAPGAAGSVLRMRRPSDSNIKGRPLVSLSQIAENLRSALDYLVFALSKRSTSDLNDRAPQFVIAESKTEFEKQAKQRLRYLTPAQVRFMEMVQPYKSGIMLALLKDMTDPSKHRHLLSLEERTGWRIVLSTTARSGEYPGMFMYPVQDGMAFFAEPICRPEFTLLGRYDAMKTLQGMIETVGDIILAARCFFFDLPFSGTIKYE